MRTKHIYFIIQFLIFILFGLYLFFNLLEIDFTGAYGSPLTGILNIGSMLLSITLIITSMFIIPTLCILKNKIVFTLPNINIKHLYQQIEYKLSSHTTSNNKIYQKHQVIRI